MDIVNELEQLQKSAAMAINRLCVIKNAANSAICKCEKILNDTETLMEISERIEKYGVKPNE